MLASRKCVRRPICDGRWRHSGTTDSTTIAKISPLKRASQSAATRLLIQMAKLCSSRTLLDAATRGGKAIAALNFYNAETLLAHMRAARASRESIILQTTESTIDYLGLRMILGMAAAAADQLEEPVALHLDHGSSYELAARCIDAGYTSVMIDGSKMSFVDNCAL